MTAEEVARKYEFSRPDAKFAGYAEVGLPFYRLRLRAFVLEKKRLDPISEFVLRAIAAGLDTDDELSEFLGVGSPVLVASLSSLQLSEDIHRTGGPNSRKHVWRLTSQGGITLGEATRTVPEQVSLEVDFDGLLRTVVNYSRAEVVAPRQIEEQSLIEIPPSPAKRPELGDVDFQGVAAYVRSLGIRRELLSVTGIEKRFLMFRRAVALRFKPHKGMAQVAFVVDGQPQEAHDDAFGRAGLLSRFGWESEPPGEQLRRLVGRELPELPVDEFPDPQQAETSRRKIHDAGVRADEAEKSVAHAASESERMLAEKEALAARSEAKALEEASRTQSTSRQLEVFEHPPLLDRAFKEAKDRLLIISPWIRAGVVNNEFLQRLERTLQRSVKVYIGYGTGDPQDIEKEWDRRARQSLERLSAKYPNFKLVNFGNTHAKVLAFDRECLVITSFNWLSFKGDSLQQFRDEQGFLTTNPKHVDDKFASQLRRFGTSS